MDIPTPFTPANRQIDGGSMVPNNSELWEIIIADKEGNNGPGDDGREIGCRKEGAK